MRSALAAAAAALTITATGCFWSGDDDRYRPAAAPRVALAAPGLGAPVTVGLLVSATSSPGEGSDVFRLAAGARVAEFRFDEGGADVALEVHDDHGTSEGAVAGVRALAAKGVVGIVAATTGPHLDAALREAAAAKLPVLLPYERRQAGDAPTSWYTGPSATQVHQRLRALLAERGLQRPFVLHGEGATEQVAGLAGPMEARVAGRQQAAAAVRPAVQAAAASDIDSVVIGASAATQAALVAQVQGRAPDVAIVLSPEALAPAFGDSLTGRLADDGTATAAGRFLTVGPDTVDATAHTKGDRAVALSAFLAGNRLAAQTKAVQALTHAVPFGEEGAATADASAHDAVVALVRAAERAGSVDPAAVTAALDGLTLGYADGLAGPALDFRSRRAFPDSGLVVLSATTRNPGLRAVAADAEPALSWFVVPAKA